MVPGNNSTKPDQTGGDGKGVKQSKMFNYSLYSRLSNNLLCFHCTAMFAYIHVRQTSGISSALRGQWKSKNIPALLPRGLAAWIQIK